MDDNILIDKNEDKKPFSTVMELSPTHPKDLRLRESKGRSMKTPDQLRQNRENQARHKARNTAKLESLQKENEDLNAKLDAALVELKIAREERDTVRDECATAREEYIIARQERDTARESCCELKAKNKKLSLQNDSLDTAHKEAFLDCRMLRHKTSQLESILSQRGIDVPTEEHALGFLEGRIEGFSGGFSEGFSIGYEKGEEDGLTQGKNDYYAWITTSDNASAIVHTQTICRNWGLKILPEWMKDPQLGLQRLSLLAFLSYVERDLEKAVDLLRGEIVLRNLGLLQQPESLMLVDILKAIVRPIW